MGDCSPDRSRELHAAPVNDLILEQVERFTNLGGELLSLMELHLGNLQFGLAGAGVFQDLERLRAHLAAGHRTHFWKKIRCVKKRIDLVLSCDEQGWRRRFRQPRDRKIGLAADELDRLGVEFSG